jgi:hypothetical protein
MTPYIPVRLPFHQQIGNLAQLENRTICDKTPLSFCRLRVIDSNLMASGNSTKVEYFVRVFPSCAIAAWFSIPPMRDSSVRDV